VLKGPRCAPGINNPRVDVTKETTTLYASDRDVFLFLVDDLNPIDAGLPTDEPPDLHFRGFYCWNPEVGAKTLGIATSTCARSDDDRQDVLRKRGFSKAETGRIVETVLAMEGRPPESVFDNKLMLSQSNVRHVKAGVSIEELAEDIARRTLLSSITVRPVLDASGAETGIYTIPAGSGSGRWNCSRSRSA